MAQQFQWEVTVFKDDKTANAFALPGGKMAVYTGIFPMAKTEAGLAAVMGHEVVHALARHGAERMSQGQATNVGIQVLGTAAGVGTGNAALGQATMAALGRGRSSRRCCFPSAENMNRKRITSAFCLPPMPGMTRENRWHLWERMAQHVRGRRASRIHVDPSEHTKHASIN